MASNCSLTARLTDLDVRAGLVCGVRLDTGSRLDADVVVLATGTQPNTEWLRGSGLDLRTACSVEPPCTPSAPTPWSAWETSPAPRIRFSRAKRSAWSTGPALDTRPPSRRPTCCSAPRSGHPQTELPVFGTTIHGAAIRGIGFPSKAESSEVVWGSIEAGQAVVGMQRRGRLVGAVALNAAAQLTLSTASCAAALETDSVPSLADCQQLP